MSNQLPERPQEQAILDVQGDLERMGARCEVNVKRQARGRWERIHDEVSSFEEALNLACKEVGGVVEVGIFLEHDQYGGIMVWTSKWPKTVNRFDDYP